MSVPTTIAEEDMSGMISRASGAKSARQRGAVLVLVVLVMFALLGVAALAVDLGYMHVVKGELQNAADAAALAGAGVLFSPTNSPPDAPQDAQVTATATATAALNKSGGEAIQSPNFLVNVYPGHYAFASTWEGTSSNAGGTFTPNSSSSQLQGWENMTFSAINGDKAFVNAVAVTISRTDVPRFFSVIFGSSLFTVTAQAIAYIGFAGTIPAGKVDAPLAVCEQSVEGPCSNDPTQQCYSCNVGRLFSSNQNSCSGSGTATQTGKWTDFTQTITTGSCTTASDTTMQSLVCGAGNPNPISIGYGVGATNGTQANVFTSLYQCWQSFESGKDPLQPWSMTLPEVDCKSASECQGNLQNCPCVVGAVKLDVIWMVNQNDPQMTSGVPGPTTQIAGAPVNPVPQDCGGTDAATGVWTCPPTCSSQPACTGNNSSDCQGQCCWDDFVTCFNLQILDSNCDLEPATVANNGYQASTIYFLPSCTPTVLGGTGGIVTNVLSQNPVLVKGVISTAQ